VVAWGFSEFGQTAIPIHAQSDVRAIALGATHAVALKRDGSVVSWGTTNFGLIAVQLDAQSGVTAIAAGFDYTMVLFGNGQMVPVS